MKGFFKYVLIFILVFVCSGLSINMFSRIKSSNSEPSKDSDVTVENTSGNVLLGVDGLGGGANPVRTDDAKDLSYSIVNGVIKSDFDNVYPYSEMSLYKDSFGNCFVKIPKFYSRFTKNDDGSVKLQISKNHLYGFSTLFVDDYGLELDYILVGCYLGSGSSAQIFSKPNADVLGNLTQDEFRTGCQANGRNYQQLDYYTVMIINQLFMVEFATMDSDSVFYPVSIEYCEVTGFTDPYTSSSCFNPDTKSFRYRWIENLWGAYFQYCDGFYFGDTNVYISHSPSKYKTDFTDDNFDGYNLVYSDFNHSVESFVDSLVCIENYYCLCLPISDISSSFDLSDKLLYLPSTSSKISNFMYGSSTSFFDSNSEAGMWAFYYISRNVTSPYYTCRLVYKPIQ